MPSPNAFKDADAGLATNASAATTKVRFVMLDDAVIHIRPDCAPDRVAFWAEIDAGVYASADRLEQVAVAYTSDRFSVIGTRPWELIMRQGCWCLAKASTQTFCEEMQRWA